MTQVLHRQEEDLGHLHLLRVLALPRAPGYRAHRLRGAPKNEATKPRSDVGSCPKHTWLRGAQCQVKPKKKNGRRTYTQKGITNVGKGQ